MACLTYISIQAKRWQKKKFEGIFFKEILVL